MPKDAPKPPIPSPLSGSRPLSELQKTHASVKLKIAQRANSIIDFLNLRISQPQNLNLLTHSSAHRLAAMIKDLISLYQSLYNALIDLADHKSRSERRTVSSSREQALEDWAEEGERLGVLCYQAKKYLGRELAYVMHDQSSFSWRKGHNSGVTGAVLEKFPLT